MICFLVLFPDTESDKLSVNMGCSGVRCSIGVVIFIKNLTYYSKISILIFIKKLDLLIK